MENREQWLEEMGLINRTLSGRRFQSIAVLQKRVSKWVNTRFGNACLKDSHERALRVLEEALELAQAAGVTSTEIVTVAEHVWSRPVGEIRQEHAGVLVSLLASATANGIDLEDAVVDEIERINAVPLAKILEKQRLKNRAGITKYKKEEPFYHD
jgi:NTP pyrophosphatase (non-canonical NTP hydrolase)